MKLRRGRQFLLRKKSKKNDQKTSKNHFIQCIHRKIHLNDRIFDRRVEKTANPNPKPNPTPNPHPHPNPNPNPNPNHIPRRYENWESRMLGHKKGNL